MKTTSEELHRAFNKGRVIECQLPMLLLSDNGGVVEYILKEK